MKKILVLLSLALISFSSFASGRDKIDEQLLQKFAIQFPNAQKVVWQESEDAYVVSFVEDGIRLRVVYLRNEALTQIIRYYLEETLPLDVRLSIKAKYPGKNIYGVTEENILSHVDNRSRTTFYVTLEDDSSWLTVKAQRHKKLKTIEKLNKEI
jgi:hypothetical protein